MGLPRISYNNYDAVSNPTGGAQEFDFMYAPTGKPLFNRQATRTDTFSTAGNRQTVTQRINQQFAITMSTIMAGDDSYAWNLFLAWAVTGGQFVYMPDSDNTLTLFTCFLVETEAQLAFSSPGVYSFTGTFQVEIQ